MTEQAIDVAHPPQALLKAINPALRLALKTSLSSALKQFTVVSFTGRTTHMHGQLVTNPEAIAGIVDRGAASYGAKKAPIRPWA